MYIYIYMYKIHICTKNRRPLVTFRYHFCPREKRLDRRKFGPGCTQPSGKRSERQRRTGFSGENSLLFGWLAGKAKPRLKSYKVAGIRVRSVHPRELWRKKGGLGGNIIARWIVHARTFLIYPPAPDCECDFPGKSRLLD